MLEGIDAAAAAGLAPIKINMVVKRGMNEAAIVPMARHFRGSGHILRFIEYMDVGAHQRLAHGRRGAGARDRRARSTREMPLEPADPNYRGEVAERWRYRDGSGEIGVIASVTQAFCRDCTRARLSTEGKLYTCLFADRRPRPARAAARRRRRRGDSARDRRDLAPARRSLFGDPHRANTRSVRKVEMSLHRRLRRAIARHARQSATARSSPTPRARSTFTSRRVDEHGEELPTPIAGEHPLTLYVDKQEILTLMTLGAAPEALAIGYLRNQRLRRIASRTSSSVQVDWDVNAVRRHDAQRPRRSRRAKTAKRTEDDRLRPGHGVRRPDGGDRQRPAARRRDARRRRRSTTLLDRVRLHETIYKQAGAVHGCALATNGAARPRS